MWIDVELTILKLDYALSEKQTKNLETTEVSDQRWDQEVCSQRSWQIHKKYWILIFDVLHRNVAPKYRLFELNSFNWLKKNSHKRTPTNRNIRRKRYNKGRHEPNMFSAFSKKAKKNEEKLDWGKKRKKHSEKFDEEKSHEKSKRAKRWFAYFLSHFNAHFLWKHLVCAYQPVWLSICLRNVFFSLANHRKLRAVSREPPKESSNRTHTHKT